MRPATDARPRRRAARAFPRWSPASRRLRAPRLFQTGQAFCDQRRLLRKHRVVELKMEPSFLARRLLVCCRRQPSVQRGMDRAVERRSLSDRQGVPSPTPTLFLTLAEFGQCGRSRHSHPQDLPSDFASSQYEIRDLLESLCNAVPSISALRECECYRWTSRRQFYWLRTPRRYTIAFPTQLR